MQVAARIDFARPQATAREFGVFALAVASGVAGLSVTNPAVTLGNSAPREWMGGFEAKVSQLAAPATSPRITVAAKFHGTGLAELAQKAPVMPVADRMKGAGLARPSSPAEDDDHRSAAYRLPEVASGDSERRLEQPAAPLDAVRIALPPAAAVGVTSGAMAPEATLERVSPPEPAPVSAAGSQALTVNGHPEVPSALATSRFPVALPLGPMSASKEVREFDLARLGVAKPDAVSRSRVSTGALAPPKATPQVLGQTVPKVAKVPDRVVGDYILHVAGLSLEGAPSGNLAVRIGMGGDLSVKLADMLIPLQNQMEPETFEGLIASSSASEYVSFADLRAAGFDVRYDAGDDRLMISARR